MALQQVDTLNEAQVEDLVALYRHEWWTSARQADDVRRMLAHTDFVFGFVEEENARLVAFARVLTDRAYKALILDVIVAPSHRSAGLARRLMDTILAHPDLHAVRHFELYCKPQLMPLYRKWGFTEELGDLRFMRRVSQS